MFYKFPFVSSYKHYIKHVPSYFQFNGTIIDGYWAKCGKVFSLVQRLFWLRLGFDDRNSADKTMFVQASYIR